MPVNRALWRRAITKVYAPAWPCPSCSDGRLRLKRDTLHFEQTAESRRLRGNEDFHQMDIRFAFSAMLECARCKENVACCGEGGYEQEPSFDQDGEPTLEYAALFFPHYFSKSMKILDIHRKIPEVIRSRLQKSFLVAFCDKSAAANHVRQCLEEILSESGIQPQNNKGKFISLEKRTNSYRIMDNQNAERASALRWIGNFGSHPEKLTLDDIFDAYDILEVLLEDLYIGHQRSVRELVERINQAKRPRG